MTDVNLKSHPKGLYYLFFAEMWERFSFYGLRALLVLYMSSQLSFSDSKTYSIYAAYFTLIYAAPIVGGFLADRLLGNRRCILFGGILITLGHLVLTLQSVYSFFLGLSFVVTGTGFFKANISTLLGQLYAPNDPRRDSGFTLFYIGINIGAFLASIVCGYLGESYGWHYGFGAASLGMILGLVTFVYGLPSLGQSGIEPDAKLLKKAWFLGLSREMVVYIVSFLSVPFFAYLLMNSQIFEFALPVIGCLTIFGVLYLALYSPSVERKSILVILALLFFHLTFFSLFEQAGSSLTLFTERFVDRTAFGFVIPSSQFQALNPLFIIVLGPFFSWLWLYLGKRNKDPHPPMKFFLALVQVALGFVALIAGIKWIGPEGSAMSWLCIAYLLHTTGELCLSPVGLSMVTKLAPKKILSTMMGVWFLSIAFAHHLAGVFSKMSAFDGSLSDDMNHILALAKYSETFLIVIKFALVMAFILLCINPLLKPVFSSKKA